jgi:hypothetical protein
MEFSKCYSNVFQNKFNNVYLTSFNISLILPNVSLAFPQYYYHPLPSSQHPLTPPKKLHDITQIFLNVVWCLLVFPPCYPIAPLSLERKINKIPTSLVFSKLPNNIPHAFLVLPNVPWHVLDIIKHPYHPTMSSCHPLLLE